VWSDEVEIFWRAGLRLGSRVVRVRQGLDDSFTKWKKAQWSHYKSIIPGPFLLIVPLVPSISPFESVNEMFGEYPYRGEYKHMMDH